MLSGRGPERFYVMRRTDIVIKVVSVILFAAFAIYLGVYLYDNIMNPFSTAPALSYTIEEGAKVSGLVAREEEIINARYDIYELLVGEGEKVSSGQAVATAYLSLVALETADEIYSLHTQIAYLEATVVSSAAPADKPGLIADEMEKLSYSVSKRDFSSVEESSLKLRALAMGSGSSDTQAQLDELNARLNALLSSLGGGAVSIVAPYSGVFSGVIDSYEDISPDTLGGLSPSELKALMSEDRSGDSSAPGKLVSGLAWYYAVTLPEEEAARFSAKVGLSVEDGGGALMRFSKNYSAELTMAVESISKPESGECVVVFSSTRGLSSTTAFRELEAEIVFSSVSGLQVPKEAVRLDEEGNTCVYIVSALQAELKRVDIVYETESYYLVINNESNRYALLEGAEIIVKASGLYDGKVIY